MQIRWLGVVEPLKMPSKVKCCVSSVQNIKSVQFLSPRLDPVVLVQTRQRNNKAHVGTERARGGRTTIQTPRRLPPPLTSKLPQQPRPPAGPREMDPAVIVAFGTDKFRKRMAELLAGPRVPDAEAFAVLWKEIADYGAARVAESRARYDGVEDPFDDE